MKFMKFKVGKKTRKRKVKDAYTVSAVLFEKEGWWVAQVLEYDIATQAKQFEDIHYELQRALVGHVIACTEIGTEPFENLPAAPKEYWDMFRKAKIRIQVEKEPFRVPAKVLPHPLPTPDLRFAVAVA